MIDLLNVNIEGLEKKYKDDKLIVFIKESFKEPLFLNIKEYKNIQIILDNNVHVNLLEENHSSCSINYILKANASLKHNLISLDESNDSIRAIDVEKGAFWHAVYVELTENNLTEKIVCTLKDEHANGEILLSTLAKKNIKKVFDVNFIHEAKNTTSIMNNYGVVQDEANLKFIGVGHIKNHAKKAIVHQNARIMIFDKKCQAAASPILKIDENDVEASHSASVGQVNEEHLFYLMSRGIDEQNAKRLITLGYLNPALPYIFDEKIKEDVEKCILTRI